MKYIFSLLESEFFLSSSSSKVLKTIIGSLSHSSSPPRTFGDGDGFSFFYVVYWQIHFNNTWSFQIKQPIYSEDTNTSFRKFSEFN